MFQDGSALAAKIGVSFMGRARPDRHHALTSDPHMHLQECGRWHLDDKEVSIGP